LKIKWLVDYKVTNILEMLPLLHFFVLESKWKIFYKI